MKKTFFLLATIIGSMFSCLKDGNYKKEFISFKPGEIDDGASISYPSTENVDSLGLIDIYKSVSADLHFWQLRSMLVYRNNKLIAENYMITDNDRTQRRAICSCTKQITAVLCCIAREKGLIDFNDKISKYFPEIAEKYPDKSDITINHLLTMRSGINYTNLTMKGQSFQITRQIPNNLTDFILSRPMQAEAGRYFLYKDCDPILMGIILQKVVNKPLDEWAQEVLFSKIGFENYTWERYRDGYTLGAFGISTSPRQLAKIALLALNKGNWNGEQIVSPDLIESMTLNQLASSSFTYTMGYLWHIVPQYNWFFMSGHGGQYAFVEPAKNLVVVFTAEPHTEDNFVINGEAYYPIVREISSICK